MSGLLGNVPWKRFWIPRETAPALGDGGYLVDPESDYGKVANAHARTLEQLEETPCVALLGEPGIGKSYVFDAYRERVRGGAGEVVDLDFRVDHDLKVKLFATRAFTRWRDDGSALTLLLDSLDEHPLGAIEVARQLVSELRGGRSEQLRLRVACRTAEWPGALNEQLERLWKKTDETSSQVAFYALAPLRRVDVAQAAGQDAEGFLEEVTRVGAEPLAIKPITLAFLLDEYRLNRRLPRERVKLYEAGCRRLCEETSLSRADRRRTGALRIEERLAIASRIAAVCILGRRSLIQVGVVRGATSPEVVRLDELMGGAEPSQVGDVSVTADAITEVLEVSGLFAPRGAGYVGWAHQTYAEFLAARFLRERTLQAEQLLREVSNPGMDRSVPALRETIAWLASMDRAFFQHLLVVDPAPLLGSDFAMMGPDECEALVAALLDRINNRALDSSIIRHNRQVQARLAHPNLGNQLRPYLAGKDRYVAARLAAIDLAVGSKVDELQNDLADLVLDAHEDDVIRSRAARAVVRLGSRETKRRLRPLVFGVCGPDPDDELKAYALEALWPEDLSATELFANLTPPKNQSQGSYGSFFHGLRKTLTPDVLTEALRWTMDVPARYRDKLSFAFQSLLDEILNKGWEFLPDEHIRTAFAEAVRRRLAVCDGIFERRNHSENDNSVLEQDDYRRRLLTSALVSLPPWGKHDAFSYVDESLVLSRDIPWAIEQLRAEPSASQRARWATILSQFERPWPFEVADPIFGALADIEELRQAMPFLPLQVEIGSPESREMRRDCRQHRKRAGHRRCLIARRHKQRLARPNPHLHRSLREFEGGALEAAVDVQYWMSFDRNGSFVGGLVDWDLSTYPGWLRSDESVRGRVLAAGREYLLNAADRHVQWTPAMCRDNPVDAGYRFICLLEKLDPVWLEGHSAIVWNGWIASVFDFVLNEDGGQNSRLVACAYRAAPTRTLEHLRLRLARDNESYGVPIVLHRVSECWDERIGRLVLDFARRPGLKPMFLGELLDDLIRRKVEGATEYAGSILVLSDRSEAAPRLRMHAAAHALMAYAPERGWSGMSPILQVDAGFGREVFLTFSREIESRGANVVWGKGLSTADAGEICFWIEGQFPRNEDPEHRSDGLHGITPREMVGDLRDALLGELISRGTPEAVAAIERIQQAFPAVDFTSRIFHAKEAAAQGTWIPRTAREIIELRPLPTPLFMNPMHANSSLPPVIVPAPPHIPATASPAAASALPSGKLVTFQKPLLRAYGQNNLAVLFGSGLSIAHDVKGNFPFWSDLPRRLLDEVETHSTISDDQIAARRDLLSRSGPLSLDVMLSELDTLKVALGNRYQEALNAIFRPKIAAQGDVHQALRELEVSALATTNYDRLLEDAHGPSPRTSYTWMESTKALGDIQAGYNVLFKIHGTADRAETVVMTRSEYTLVAADTQYQGVMRHLLQTHTFLFVGYGINDPHDLDLVFKSNAKVFGSAGQTHYALMKDARLTDIDYWRNEFNVQVIPYHEHADLPAILRQLRATKQ